MTVFTLLDTNGEREPHQLEDGLEDGIWLIYRQLKDRDLATLIAVAYRPKDVELLINLFLRSNTSPQPSEGNQDRDGLYCLNIEGLERDIRQLKDEVNTLIAGPQLCTGKPIVSRDLQL